MTFSKSVQRVIQIMKIIAAHPNGMRVSEVAKFSGMNRTTTHRLMTSLARESWVARIGDNRSFGLGPGFLAFCHQSIGTRNMLSEILPFAEELTKVSHETTHIGVLLNYKLLHVFRVRSIHQLGLSSEIGEVSEAFCTALGKALLAGCPEPYLDEYLRHTRLVAQTQNTITDRRQFIREIERVRNSGFALDREESSLGVVCLGVRIAGNHPDTVVAMSITGPSSRFSVQRATLLAPRAIEIARRAADSLARIATRDVRGSTTVARQVLGQQR
jgi:IclR family transcriptional regulator, KDG regulon repressor